MATAFLFPLHNLFAPLQALAAWFTRRPARNDAAGRTPAQRAALQRPKPLRVVRVAEPSAAGSAGRMVISGRLADVCAELDRLAELEARQERAACASCS